MERNQRSCCCQQRGKSAQLLKLKSGAESDNRHEGNRSCASDLGSDTSSQTAVTGECRPSPGCLLYTDDIYPSKQIDIYRYAVVVTFVLQLCVELLYTD